MNYWLISYRYVSHYRHDDGVRPSPHSNDEMRVIDKHPADWLIESRNDLAKLHTQRILHRADYVEIIYSAVKIDKDQYLKLTCNL